MNLIKLNKDNNIIPNKDITYYLNPDFVFVPILVKDILSKQDDWISLAQVIGKKGQIAPISGYAYGMKKCCINGIMSNTLVIENDYREMSKIVKKRKKVVNIANILKVISESKDKKLLDKFKSKSYETIIISAIEDNPYVYNKIYLLKEHIMDIMKMSEKLGLIYTSKEILLVVKNKDSQIILEALKVLGSFPKIKLTLVDDEYGLEQKDNLIKKLNIKRNILYLDVFDVVKLDNLLNNETSTTKLITISGNAIENSKVIRVKKYTLLKDIIDKFIEIKSSKFVVVVNGLMSGYKVDNFENLIITEDIESITLIKPIKKETGKCIRCGKCIDICPKGVNPLTLEGKEKCINCGLCTYICPVYINLKERLIK